MTVFIPYRIHFFNTLICLSLIGITGCNQPTSIDQEQENTPTPDVKFALLSPDITGVDFANHLTEDYVYNIFTFEYLYNGGGVAVGDVNGDGLPDLYFSSTFGSNKLYLNTGNMTFRDVTQMSGVEAAEGFKTGVLMADINGDGLLDIHSCRTSKTNDGKKTDFIFINTGHQTHDGLRIPIFKEQAQSLGLDDNSNTTHVCYFDMDNDGDLDVFYLNHRVDFTDATKLRVQQNSDGSLSRIISPATPFESNKLYRNDGGHFMEITVEAGLVNAAFGLSVIPVDINRDGWMDLYVANDYIEPDQIYINNRDGTFTDKYSEYLKHSSQNSMGCDIADINNDGLVDIIVLDMKAGDHIRYKELANVMQPDRYQLLVQYGYGRQTGRNMLQLNMGNNQFAEIGQYAGVASTDWSWAPLLADFNNDGYRDLYITNGYRKDVTNLDYLNFFRDSVQRAGGLSSSKFPDIEEFLKYIPQQKVSNYLFVNLGQLSFKNSTRAAGVDQLSFSNGAAYADLDLDGDLDLIVNNINDHAFIYENRSHTQHWIQIKVELEKGNTAGLGVQADVYAGTLYQHAVVGLNHGFLSSSEPILHFGLGAYQQIDSIILRWPDGSAERLDGIVTNQRLIWKKGFGKTHTQRADQKPKPLFQANSVPILWKHQEDDFNDFKREKLIPYMLSAEGPCISVGDMNGDGLDDIYAGNGSGYPGSLIFQDQQGVFLEKAIAAFNEDTAFEDCGSVMGDFDLDGDLDLIVISGGSAFQSGAPQYLTRHYINDGKGKLSRSNAFPQINTNAGAVLAVDYDQDGDLDIIIGGRGEPGSFPNPSRGFCLRNDNGIFRDVTADIFPEISEIGRILDIKSADIDGDGKPEIVLVGEWMPITIYSFDGKVMKDKTKHFGLEGSSGWWKTVALEDIDQDGDIDIVAGNIGLNHRLQTSVTHPVTLITNDFDDNGSLDPILCYYSGDKRYPFIGRDAMIAQLPMMKKKFLRYAPYASASVEDIFSIEQLSASSILTVNTFETTLFINEKNSFNSVALPYQVQLSPVYDIIISDFNHDGRMDILMAGNFSYAETETGEMDAGCGTLLLQQENGIFEFIDNRQHGFWACEEVRTLSLINRAKGTTGIVTGNNRSNIELNLLIQNEKK